MAGESNLIPVRSVDEAREKGKKGGKASGKVRREKALLRDAADLILAKKLPTGESGEIEKTLERMGVPKGQRTHAMAMVIGMVAEAEGGNPAAFEKIMKLMGEGVEKVEHSGEFNNPFAGLTTEELRRLANDD